MKLSLRASTRLAVAGLGCVWAAVCFAQSVPTLTSLSPLSAAAGASATTLTVNGTNFQSGAVVNWAPLTDPTVKTALTTTYVSATQLTAVIPAALLVKAGGAQITVVNTDNGTTAVPLVFSILLGSGKVITVAGPGGAVSAGLSYPTGMTRDSAGNVYVANISSYQVSKITPDGVVTTVAGNGVSAVSGDGGPATSASLKAPISVAVDGSGNLFIADINGHTVRKVGTDGIIRPYAGTGVAGNSGDGGAATSATLSSPSALAMDSLGRLYISSGVLVRRVDSNGTISTVAGSGTAGFSGDGGAATSAQLGTSWAMAFDGADNLYIADASYNRVRMVTPAGIISTIAGGGTGGDGALAVNAMLYVPDGVAVDSAGIVYVSEQTGRRIRMIVPGGVITTLAGNSFQGFGGDGGPAINAYFDSPRNILLMSPSTLYIADGANQRIRAIALSGNSASAPSNITLSSNSAIVGSAALPLTVHGTNFAPGAVINWGGTALTTALVSPTTLTTTVPASLLNVGGTVGVTVTSISGTSASASFTVVVPSKPTITNLSPSTVAGGSAGFNLTITGANYFSGATVNWGGTALTPSAITSTQITVAVAANLVATAGTISVSVTSLGGTSDPQSFVVSAPPPVFTSLTPLSVDAGAGATTLTVNGSNFQSGAAIKWNGTALTTTYVSATQLTAALSASQLANAGGAQITVANPDGLVSGSKVFSVLPTAGTISTLVGSSNGTLGDGGPATAATLNIPAGTAFDSAGNYYIADWNNYRVRKVTTDGKIATIAGTGTSATSGDGGPATAAELRSPIGVAVDGSGNVYIADVNGRCVRKIDASGTITTITGNGNRDYSGDGGPAANAVLLQATAVAFDSVGRLYIADGGAIRRIDFTTGIITTVAGTGTAGYSGDNGPATSAEIGGPYGIALDSADNLFIADTGNNRIRMVTPAGMITTVAGTGTASSSGDGGLATSATLNSPVGVAVGANGMLYIAEQRGYRIRAMQLGGAIKTIAGTGAQDFSGDGGPATSATFGNLWSILAASANTLYVADGGNNRIRAITLNGIGAVTPSISSLTPSTVFSGVADFTLTVAGTGFSPDSVVKWGATTLTTTVINTHSVVATVPASLVTAANGGTISVTVVSNGQPSNAQNFFVEVAAKPTITDANPKSAIAGSADVALTVTGTNYYSSVVTVKWNGTALTTTYVSSTQVTAVVPASLLSTPGVAHLTVASRGGESDAYNFTIAVPPPTATAVNPVTVEAGKTGVTVTISGANFLPGATVQWNTDSLQPTTVTPSQITLTLPNSYTAVVNQAQVRVVNPDAQSSSALVFSVHVKGGLITTVAGTGVRDFSGENGPAKVASLMPSALVTDASGNIFVADTANYRVLRISPDGTLTRIAGTGQQGYSGDGGPAINASLTAPGSLALDPDGSLYVGEQMGFRIRRIAPDGTISTIAGDGTVGFSGDGGPASNARLDQPWCLAVDAQKNLYVCDGQNRRIRKISFPDRVITTIAGTGAVGYSGDGAVATNAAITTPTAIGFDSAGNLYFPDYAANVIRKIGTNGIISTIAGSGVQGDSGDDGPALNARLYGPIGIAFDQQDNLYFADRFNHRVRVVTPAGIIATVAGTGTAGFSGDGGVATAAQMNEPSGVALAGSQVLFVTEVQNKRLRALSLLGLSGNAPVLSTLEPASTIAGTGAVPVAINGSGFTPGTVVKAGGAARDTTFVNTTRLTATLPATDTASSGNLDLTVVSEAGSSTPATFVVSNSAPPVIAKLLPSSAPVGLSPLRVTIRGANFMSNSTVNWGGTSLTPTFVNATELSVDVPRSLLLSAGGVSITVTTALGTSSVAPFQVVMAAPVVITGFNPAFLVSPSDVASVPLTVIGRNFTPGAMQFIWMGRGLTTTCNSTTELSVSVPQEFLQAPFDASVGVLTGAGQYAEATLPVYGVPVIRGTAPASVVAGTPGFELTITGKNFVPGLTKLYWNLQELTVSSSTTTQLVANVPASFVTSSASSVILLAISPYATSTIWNFEVTAAPTTIGTLVPSSVFAGAANFVLTVNGTGFTPAHHIYWDGNALATTYVNPKQLTASITADLIATPKTVPVAVADAGGALTRAASFFVQPPSVSITVTGPKSGTIYVVGDSYQVTVTGLPGKNVALSTAMGSCPAGSLTLMGSTNATSGVYTYQGTWTATDVADHTETWCVDGIPGAPALQYSVKPANLTISGTVGADNAGATVQLSGSKTATATASSTGEYSFVVDTFGTYTVTPSGSSHSFAPVSQTIRNITNNARLDFATADGTQPTITALTPSSASAGSDALTLTVDGTGFVTDAIVSFGGTALSTTYVSATRLTARVPASALLDAGTRAVTVSASTGVSSSRDFTVTVPIGPHITSVSVSSVGEVSTATIAGTGFGAPQGASTITFGGTAASVTAWSDISITATIPSGMKSGKVVVTVGGVLSNEGSFNLGPTREYIYLGGRVIAIENNK